MDVYQLGKGNTWYFGYNNHIGVDKDCGLGYTVGINRTNTHGVMIVPKLLISREKMSRKGENNFVQMGK